MRNKKISSYLFVALFLGLLLRIFLSGYLTYYNDLYTFQFWSLDLIKGGFGNFYNLAICDYLPGYLYILWFLGKIFWWFLNHSILLPVELVYKLPGIIADLINSCLIYLIVSRYLSLKKALFAALLFLFNPFVLANSTIWGQVDSFMMTFLLTGLYFLLTGNYHLSALMLGIGQTVKPIAIFCLPYFLAYLFLVNRNKKDLVKYGLVFGAVLTVIFLPFNTEKNLFSFILSRYLYTTDFRTLITVNAFNFWAGVTILLKGSIRPISDQLILGGISYQIWGYILFAIVTLFAFIQMLRRRLSLEERAAELIFALTITYLAFYTFFTRIHERHMFYALSFLVCLFPWVSYKAKIVTVILSLVYLLNLTYAYLSINKENAFPSPIILVLSILVAISLFTLVFDLYRMPAVFNHGSTGKTEEI